MSQLGSEAIYLFIVCICIVKLIEGYARH